MVPTQPCADRPPPQANQVLDKGGLLKVRAAVDEVHGWGSNGIELAWISDLVVESFVQERGIYLSASFEFVIPVTERECPLSIDLAEVVMLEGNDRRRVFIGR